MEVQLDPVRSAGECLVDRVLVADMPVVADVARHLVMHQRRARRDRGLHGGDARQVLEADLDQFGRILRLLLGLGDDDGDGVADMTHLADREHRMLRLGHRRAVLVVDLPAARHAADAVGVQIGTGVHGDHARSGFGCRGVNGQQARVWPVGAAHHGVELARTVDIVGVVTAAAQEPVVFLALDGRADAFEAHDMCPPDFFSLLGRRETPHPGPLPEGEGKRRVVVRLLRRVAYRASAARRPRSL